MDDKELSNIMSRWAQERIERMALTKGAVAQIRKAMKEHGIAECQVRYSGSGDSGDAETCLYLMEDGSQRAPVANAHWENEGVPALEATIKDYRDVVSSWSTEERMWVTSDRARDVDISDIVCDVAMSYVSDRHGGWENNEGGFGEVTLTATSVVVNHSDNIIETVNSVERYDDMPEGDE